ncbi:MAG: lysM, partial [Paenibacillaceae bacterium]|nr:lysM [Paenibacillaceae bacterium]
MKIHIVKQGDTLFEIAKKYGVTLDQLKAANPQITDPDKIDVGQKVKIPAAGSSVPTPPAEYKHKHTVAQGDTLWKISKAWEVPLQALI